MKRQAIFHITTPEQLRGIGSPVTFEVLEALQTGGPCTTAELGARMGRKGNSLHYHVRKLGQLGLVAAVDTRRSGARTETVYDVVADRFDGPTAPRDPVMRRAVTDTVAALMRRATRDFARAVETPDGLTTDGTHRNILAQRNKAWLTDGALVEVNEHVEAICEIMRRHADPGGGELHAVTVIMTPLNTTPTSRPDDPEG